MVAKNSKLSLVVAGLLLGILMASMDNTIVVTAMGTIVGDLGGLENFVWVVSAYMVAEMAGMPIFGKLSDMYGRKRFFIFGLIVFMIGSALCGTAENITQLGIYRAIQGIGGGDGDLERSRSYGEVHNAGDCGERRKSDRTDCKECAHEPSVLTRIGSNALPANTAVSGCEPTPASHPV